MKSSTTLVSSTSTLLGRRFLEEAGVDASVIILCALALVSLWCGSLGWNTRDARRWYVNCDYITTKRLIWGAWVVHHTPLGAKLHEPGSNSVVMLRTRRELSDSAAGVALRNRWRRQATVGELSLEASSRSCSRGAVQPCSTVQPCTVTARVLL